jgi:DNA-binding response OmpR family regulator
MACILSIGRDPHLMTARTLLLKGAGYVVDVAHDRAAALSRAQCDSVDALLICHTIANADKRWLIANIRQKRRLLPILCLTNGTDESSADGCIAVDSDPEALLQALC